MSTWYDKKEISLESVRNSISHFEQRRIKKKEEIENGQHHSFGVFNSYIGNCRFLCAGLLFLKEFDRIKDIRMSSAEISFQGQESYGFKCRESKYMLHDAVLSRNKKFYQDMANRLKEKEIINDIKGLQGYGSNSLYSLIWVITKDERSKDMLKIR